MPHSSATLFYGLWVKTWSLAFAADAHAKIKPALLAIDLITLRRRSGKLVAEAQDSKTTVRDVPSEVWELVKQELIEEALWDEELAALRKYRCSGCLWSLSFGGSTQSSEHRRPPWGAPISCILCLLHLGRHGLDRMAWFEDAERCSNVEELLTPHGLHLVSPTTWKQQPTTKFDFDELSPIAFSLPLAQHDPRGSEPSPVISSCASPFVDANDDYSDSNVLAFSSEALALPSNAELRFRRLISTYRLQVVDRVESTIIPPPPTSTSNETDCSQPDTEKDKREKAEFGKGEPRWMLWSLAGPWD